MLVKTARPSGWKWDGGQVIVEYRMFLDDDADCTNIIKTLEDAIFPALGINDTFALPRAMSKEVVKKNEARIEVTIG